MFYKIPSCLFESLETSFILEGIDSSRGGKFSKKSKSLSSNSSLKRIRPSNLIPFSLAHLIQLSGLFVSSNMSIKSMGFLWILHILNAELIGIID